MDGIIIIRIIFLKVFSGNKRHIEDFLLLPITIYFGIHKPLSNTFSSQLAARDVFICLA
jgi:hypothetical protein